MHWLAGVLRANPELALFLAMALAGLWLALH